MAGICGIVSADATAELAPRLGAMLDSLRLYDWYGREAHVDERRGVAVGRAALGFVNTAPQPVFNADGTRLVVMDGELYDYDEQRRALEGAGAQFRSDSHAEVLLFGYERAGRDFFGGLHGKFVAAIVDFEARRTTLVNDRYGMRPSYYAVGVDTFLFASEIKALLTQAEVARSLNRRGIAQFFSYGQLWGEDTFYSAVRSLPAAAWVTYDWQARHVEVERYHRFSPTVGPTTDAQWIGAIDEAFARAVSRSVSGTARLGISLSGGLDARSVLALVDHERVAIRSLSLGMNGSLDHRCAERLSATTNRDHHSHILASDFLANFATHMRHMTRLTDGHYLSQCIVIPTLPVYRELGIEVLLRGHAGELMHMTKAYNFSLDAAGLAIDSDSALESWLWTHLRAYMLDQVRGPLIEGMSADDMEALARGTLQTALAESDDIEPPISRIWHLFVSERLRRETAMSLVEFGSVVETRVPFLDNELVDLLLSAPTHLKLGETIQASILKRHRAEFLDVVNANTGARIGAAAWTQKIASLRMRVLAKLGVAGYQPYERLGLWLRQELVPLVRELLLGERCLARGVFVPDTVRAVVEDHFANRANHTYLLLAMMIFELGQREFVDGDAQSGERLADTASGATRG
jgi:asparagine synthase (glutamine-hydrolysing)